MVAVSIYQNHQCTDLVVLCVQIVVQYHLQTNNSMFKYLLVELGQDVVRSSTSLGTGGGGGVQIHLYTFQENNMFRGSLLLGKKG